MNCYKCAKCGANWFSATVVVKCPNCGGEMLYAGPAVAESDNKVQEVALVEELEAYATGSKVPSGGKDGKVMCPLLSAGITAIGYCRKEKCAWWGGECAISALAKAVHYLAYDKPQIK